MSSVIRVSGAGAARGRSSVAEAARMFRRSGSAMFGLALVAVLGAAAVLAPLLAPHDPDVIDTARRLARPFTPGHPLGTDEFGRDLLSRLLHGARTSLVVGLAATALAAAAGSGFGLLAGFVGRSMPGGSLPVSCSGMRNPSIASPSSFQSIASPAVSPSIHVPHRSRRLSCR